MMTCEKARKLCGEDMFYLADPYVNLDVLDLYQADTGAAWLLVAKFMYNFTTSHSPKILAHVKKIGNATYYWISYDIVISRLWHYGIRSRSTVCNAFASLCEPRGDLPPLLLKHSEINTYGRPMVYYAPTEMFNNLFVQHPSSIVKQNQDRMLAGESSEVSNEVPEPEEEQPKPPEKATESFIFPDWWDHFWEELSTTGKYTDKIYKDKYPTVVNGYVQDAVEAISSILDGTYYNKGFYGEEHDVRYDLGTVTIDSIVDAMKKYNVKEPVTMKEVVCPFPGRGKHSKKSRFMSLLCVGTEWPKDNAPVKPKSFYEADKPDNAPNWIWEPHQLPSLYPEIQQDDRKFWGFYVTAMEYIDDCQKNKGTDRTKWGLWAKLNNGLTNPANNIFMDIFRSAKEAEMSLDEVYSMHMGDVNNFLWILTARRVKHSHSIKILPDGKDYSYVYGDGPLNRSKYERR